MARNDGQHESKRRKGSKSPELLWRRKLRLAHPELAANEEFSTKAKVERRLIKKFLGEVMRKDGLENLATSHNRSEGKGLRGIQQYSAMERLSK